MRGERSGEGGIMMREKRGSRENGERKEREMGWVKVEVREERAEKVKRGRKWKGIERIVVGGKEREGLEMEERRGKKKVRGKEGGERKEEEGRGEEFQQSSVMW